jgi:cytochrome c oxidase subunit 4
MSAESHHIKASIRTYLFIFGALTALTVLTVAASWLHLSLAAGIILALLIASVKGSLVAAYFMHMLHERKALYALVALCALFFIALILLPVWQTSETVGLMDPVYAQMGETRPEPTAPQLPGHGHGDGHAEAAGGGH